MTADAPTIGWRDLMTFLSPAGQDQIADLIARAKQDRGSNWIEEIQTEYPMLSWILELVCTRDAETAFEEMQQAYPAYPLYIAKGQLINMHAWLRTEIERKR